MKILNKQLHTFKKNQFYNYLAGFIDGDGSIMIIKQKYSKTPYYGSYISITVENKEIIDLIHSRIGGRRRKRHGKYYEISWSHQGALTVLMRIRNLLVLKSQQAQLAIKLQLLNNQKGNHNVDKQKWMEKENYTKK